MNKFLKQQKIVFFLLVTSKIKNNGKNKLLLDQIEQNA